MYACELPLIAHSGNEISWQINRITMVYAVWLFLNHTQVRRCEVCQRSKRKFDKPSPMLHPIPVSDTWKKVGIDLIELPKSRNGNQYCITLTDYFSKWPEAEAVPTKEARHVAAFLYKMILRHGCPEEIVSDQGREFCNQLIDLLEELTGFKHKITSAYHPQSNGLDERLNQTLKSKLQKLVNEHMDDWDELIDNILFAYRSSRQDSTKCTPFLLMYHHAATERLLWLRDLHNCYCIPHRSW